MRALVADASAVARVAIRDVPDAEASRGEVLVDVHSISVNRGELTRLSTALDGWRPGWDFAGVVRSAAPESPPVGERVVGLLTAGAWAERVAAPVRSLAKIPDNVSFGQAAALPTAGLTALRTLRLGRGILGRRVLITGASGGVGRFAVQLARLGGAEVSAIVSNPERAEGLRQLGADEIVTRPDQLHGRYDLILESVGGESLARLATMVHPRGTLVMFGNTSNQTTTFDVRDVYLGGMSRLQSFSIFATLAEDPPARDLAYLLGLVSEKRLDPQLQGEFPWQRVADALRGLADRQSHGKLVLHLKES